MPLPGPGLQSENTGLRGGKQPRCKLALTLPGVDRIGTASQPCTEFCGPKNKLLKFSMENKSTMTTNSILTTDSNLSSKLLSTSNPLLSLSSQSHLTNKLSTSISPSGLLNSSLMSTHFLISNKPSDLDTAFSALTSNVSLSSNCAITSSSFLPSGGTPLSTENQTFNPLLSQKNTTLRSSVFADSAGDHSFCVNNQLDISNPSNSVSAVSSGVSLSLKSSFAPKTEPLNSASNVQSTLGLGQEKFEVFESQEDDLPEDTILVNSSEGESESSDTEVQAAGIVHTI